MKLTYRIPGTSTTIELRKAKVAAQSSEVVLDASGNPLYTRHAITVNGELSLTQAK